MNVKLLDIHTHRTGADLKRSIKSFDVGEVAGMFFRNNLTGLTADSDSLSNFPFMFNSYFSIGFHPIMMNKMPAEDYFLLFESFVSKRNCLAIGECGFDKRSNLSIDEQRMVVMREIEVSERLKKPIIWHNVSAWSELLQMHKEVHPSQPWIMHGFRRGKVLARQLLDKGFYLSFGELYNPESLRLAHERQLMLCETDESSYSVTELILGFSEIIGISVEKLIIELSDRAEGVFLNAPLTK